MKRKNSFFENLRKFADSYSGDFDRPKPHKRPEFSKPAHLKAEAEDAPEVERDIKRFFGAYDILSILFALMLIAVLLMTVSYLPRFGEGAQPAMGEVAVRYIEKGLEETGATNIVAGMILDYRAFDTFGESCVLFCAVACVFMLLKVEFGGQGGYLEYYENDRIYEPKNDSILQHSAFVLAPAIMLFGFYIVLNGHLSPGGGFSGGAVIGSGMILYLLAFGFKKTGRFFSEKMYRTVAASALIFYCVVKGYAFFTGANGLENGIPLGTPENILSAGLILPLNICVGMIVANTMYAFYVMFRKGGF